MVSLSCTPIRGGKISDVGDEGAPGYRGGMAGNPQTKKDWYALDMSEFPVLKARYQYQKAGLVGTSVGYQGQPIHSLYS